jgi:hypothetical protein
MDEKNIQIIRMNSLNNSVSLIKELTTNPSVTEVVRLATMLATYVKDGSIPIEKLKKVDMYFKNKNVDGTTNESAGAEID